MDDDIAIKAQGVHKEFQLPHERVGSVKNIVTGLLKNLRTQHSYEKQHALIDVSFEIKKGEFFGIVGRNGSGKSTMLKMLAGIYQPTKGTINVVGKLVPFIELGVGFNPELTGKENVYLNGAMLGFSPAELDVLYPDIVEFAELEKFMDQKLKNYSSGMQVRLAFSMAIRAEADILLVDEVLAVGDADFQRKCFAYFRKLKKNKKTVVFVTHDMGAIREYCDKAILIDKGRVKFAGKSEIVAKEYVKLFNPEQLSDNQKIKKTKKDKWGTGTVDIKSVDVSHNILKNIHEEIIIKVEIEALKDFDNSLIPGITIKNQAGQPICGTNSRILQYNTPAMKKNDLFQVEWKVPNIFNEGIYIIEPAVADGYDMSICQWWDSAIQFEVINEQKTPYIVAPKIKVKLVTKSEA